MLPTGNFRCRHCTGHHPPWSFTMAPVWATLMQGCVGGLLDGVRRMVDEAPCPCRARRTPVDLARGRARSPADPAPDPVDEPDAPRAVRPRRATSRLPGPEAGQAALLHHLPLDGDGELPPAPWRWRWVWATPGRPSGHGPGGRRRHPRALEPGWLRRSRRPARRPAHRRRRRRPRQPPPPRHHRRRRRHAALRARAGPGRRRRDPSAARTGRPARSTTRSVGSTGPTTLGRPDGPDA